MRGCRLFTTGRRPPRFVFAGRAAPGEVVKARGPRASPGAHGGVARRAGASCGGAQPWLGGPGRTAALPGEQAQARAREGMQAAAPPRRCHAVAQPTPLEPYCQQGQRQGGRGACRRVVSRGNAKGAAAPAAGLGHAWPRAGRAGAAGRPIHGLPLPGRLDGRRAGRAGAGCRAARRPVGPREILIYMASRTVIDGRTPSRRTAGARTGGKEPCIRRPRRACTRLDA